LRKVLSRLDDDKPREELLDELVELAAAVVLLALWPATGAAIVGLMP
jgi:hypothetical protein